MKHAVAVALGLAVLTGSAAADDVKVGGVKGGDDQTFVQKASAGGLAEVNHGELAVKNASNSDVKKFAQKMIDDHTKANKELLKLADEKKFKAAAKMDDEHQKMQDKLAKLSGAEFDRVYMEGQVKDHEETVALFEKESKNGQDTDLKNWAEKKLPALREHLKMAKDIHAKVKDGKVKGR